MSDSSFVEFELHSSVPAWNASSTEGTLSSDTLKGQKYILYFYPKDLTPGCTIQAENLRDNIKELEKNNVVVIGVSPDPIKKHMSFCEKKESLPWTLH